MAAKLVPVKVIVPPTSASITDGEIPVIVGLVSAGKFGDIIMPEDEIEKEKDKPRKKYGGREEKEEKKYPDSRYSP